MQKIDGENVIRYLNKNNSPFQNMKHNNRGSNNPFTE